MPVLTCPTYTRVVSLNFDEVTQKLAQAYSTMHLQTHQSSRPSMCGFEGHFLKLKLYQCSQSLSFHVPLVYS